MVILYDKGQSLLKMSGVDGISGISWVPEALQEKFFLQEIDPGNGLVLYFGGLHSNPGSISWFFQDGLWLGCWSIGKLLFMSSLAMATFQPLRV